MLKIVQENSNKLERRIITYYLQGTRISSNMVEMLQKYYRNEIEITADEIDTKKGVLIDGMKNNREDEKNTEWMPLDSKLRGKVIKKIWFSGMSRENLIWITLAFVYIIGTIWVVTKTDPGHRGMEAIYNLVVHHIGSFLFIMIFVLGLCLLIVNELIPMIKTTIYVFRGKGYIGTAKVLKTRYDDGRICGREIVSRAYYELTIMMNKEGKEVQYELGYTNYCGEYERETVRYKGRDLKIDKKYVVVVTVDEKFFVLLE
ncbi:MAG: hypothetical protein HDT39_03220 [Lachnospiraceae bacterium]|nr:hypothetical protein [Lachnospiraceae bacterium]